MFRYKSDRESGWEIVLKGGWVGEDWKLRMKLKKGYVWFFKSCEEVLFKKCEIVNYIIYYDLCDMCVYYYVM